MIEYSDYLESDTLYAEHVSSIRHLSQVWALSAVFYMEVCSLTCTCELEICCNNTGDKDGPFLAILWNFLNLPLPFTSLGERVIYRGENKTKEELAQNARHDAQVVA